MNICNCHLTCHSYEYGAKIHMCIISKVIGINEEEEICLLNKEDISSHRCERKNTTGKLKYL